MEDGGVARGVAVPGVVVGNGDAGVAGMVELQRRALQAVDEEAVDEGLPESQLVAADIAGYD